MLKDITKLRIETDKALIKPVLVEPKNEQLSPKPGDKKSSSPADKVTAPLAPVTP